MRRRCRSRNSGRLSCSLCRSSWNCCGPAAAIPRRRQLSSAGVAVPQGHVDTRARPSRSRRARWQASDARYCEPERRAAADHRQSIWRNHLSAESDRHVEISAAFRAWPAAAGVIQIGMAGADLANSAIVSPFGWTPQLRRPKIARRCPPRYSRLALNMTMARQARCESPAWPSHSSCISRSSKAFPEPFVRTSHAQATCGDYGCQPRHWPRGG
jgi:hypothetical protein